MMHAMTDLKGAEAVDAQNQSREEKYQLSCYELTEWDRCFSQGKSSYLVLKMHEEFFLEIT